MYVRSILSLVGLSVLTVALGAGAAPKPAKAPARRAPLAEHLARAEASVRALDHHLATAAVKPGQTADARLVDRARRLTRHHNREPLAWREYVQRVPGVVDVTTFRTDVAQRDAESAAASLGDDLDALWAKRRQIEAERMVLWARIAFRAVADRELSEQPLYFFELKTPGKTDDEQRMEAVKAAAQFVRVVDHIAGQAQEAVDADPSAVYDQWHKLLASARGRLQEKLLTQAVLALDVSKPTTETGQVAAQARQLVDLAQNIVDANRALAAAEKADDDEEADASRAQLQQALADTAGAVAALDTSVAHAANAWGISVVPGTKAAVGELPDLKVGPEVVDAQRPTADWMNALSVSTHGKWEPDAKWAAKHLCKIDLQPDGSAEIRGRINFASDFTDGQVHIRLRNVSSTGFGIDLRKSDAGFYGAFYNKDFNLAGIGIGIPGKGWRDISSAHLDPHAPVTDIEFSAAGNLLVLSIGGREIVRANDASLSNGAMGLEAIGPRDGVVQVDEVRIKILHGSAATGTAK